MYICIYISIYTLNNNTYISICRLVYIYYYMYVCIYDDFLIRRVFAQIPCLWYHKAQPLMILIQSLHKLTHPNMICYATLQDKQAIERQEIEQEANWKWRGSRLYGRCGKTRSCTIEECRGRGGIYKTFVIIWAKIKLYETLQNNYIEWCISTLEQLKWVCTRDWRGKGQKCVPFQPEILVFNRDVISGFSRGGRIF